MSSRGAPVPVLAMIRSPFRDLNFRRVIIFMASWNLASNIAAPFITVYLLRQMGFELGTVTAVDLDGNVLDLRVVRRRHGLAGLAALRVVVGLRRR